MRAVRCWCGELIVADDDDALARELTAHAEEAHPDDVRSPDAVAAHVAAEGEAAPDRPPWAY